MEYWAKGEDEDNDHLLEGGVRDFGFIFNKELNRSYEDMKQKIDYIKNSNILQFEFMQYLKYVKMKKQQVMNGDKEFEYLINRNIRNSSQWNDL